MPTYEYKIQAGLFFKYMAKKNKEKRNCFLVMSVFK